MFKKCLGMCNILIFSRKSEYFRWNSEFLFFQNIFLKSGGNLRDNCPVKQIFPVDESMVKIELLDGSEVMTKSLVVCAGPWTNKLMNPIG